MVAQNNMKGLCPICWTELLRNDDSSKDSQIAGMHLSEDNYYWGFSNPKQLCCSKECARTSTIVFNIQLAWQQMALVMSGKAQVQRQTPGGVLVP